MADLDAGAGRRRQLRGLRERRLHGVADNSIGLSPPTPARVQFTVRPSTGAPTVTTSKPYVAPGGTLTVTGSGFAANESVAITFGSATLKTGKATPKDASRAQLSISRRTPISGPQNWSSRARRQAFRRLSRSTSPTAGRSTEVHRFEQAADPNDSVFRDHLVVSSSTFLKQAWTFNTGAPISGSALVSDGDAFVANRAGTVDAISVATRHGGVEYHDPGVACK